MDGRGSGGGLNSGGRFGGGGRGRRIGLLAIAAILILIPGNAERGALAYPISPVTLWGLTEEADLVVLADITNVTQAEETDGTPLRDAPSSTRLNGAGSVAHLRVREVWKGEAPGAITVDFDPNYICPAPPRYVVGKTVIAFLYDQDGHWRTVALSYGTRYPDAGEIGTYRDLVGSAKDVMSRWPATKAERLDWLVRAASFRATRWDGLYDLMPEGDSLHSYYDQKTGDRPGSAGLTDAHYQRLARGFSEQPSTDRTLVMILALFEGRPSFALDRAAIASLESVLLADRPPWWIDEALKLLLRRLGDSAPEARLAVLGDEFDEKDAATVRVIWTRAKADLGLPEIPGLPLKQPEVWGVGSNTPD